ncbi:MAG: hypothetical protein Q9190_004554 [Brigantiaea leucoxantha]
MSGPLSGPRKSHMSTLIANYKPESSAEPRSLLKSAKDTWEKCREDRKSFLENMSDDVIYYLYKPIREALEKAPKEQGHFSKVMSEIEDFLKDEKNQEEIDDCIRWLLLFKAVESTETAEEKEEEGFVMEIANESINSETNPNILITQIIVRIAPHLAFECPYKKVTEAPAWKKARIENRCMYKDHKNRKSSSMKTTPFHKAAENGDGKAIKHMISCAKDMAAETSGKSIQHQSLLRVLRMTSPDSHKKSALWFAATNEAGKLGALRELLNFDNDIVDPSDRTFENALKEGSKNVVDVVNVFLQFPKLRKIFVTSHHIIQAMGCLSDAKPGSEEREHREGIVNTLIGHATTGDVINDDVVDKIIELNLKDIWVNKISKIELNTSRLLHLAVKHQNADFVGMFLHEYPDSVTQKQDGNYPLWYNNKIWEGSGWTDRKSKEYPEPKKIRDLIVTATIKHKSIDKMQDLLQIFQDSGQNVNELCFDLSRFNSKVYPVSDFVRSLIAHQDNTHLLSYEHTIRYAEFPALDLKADEKETFGDSVHDEHSEVFQVLNWLKKKGVNEIIELTVPDRLVNSHSELEIGEYVKDFEVEVLNWRFLDMSISIFEDPKTRGRIRELHLYSSGKRAVISHWLSEGGVVSMPKDVHQELMTKENCRKTVEFTRVQFQKLSDRINKAREAKKLEKLTVNVIAQLWNPTHERVADLEEIAERAVPKLSRFIKSYHDYVHDVNKESSSPFRPTKVAIIDNGILTISPMANGPRDLLTAQHRFDGRQGISVPNNEHLKQRQQGPDASPTSNNAKNYKTLWSRIMRGRSFVDDNSRVSPWLFASDPHGTQMANLICAIDPWCELYVAKVAESRSGITPERVTRAIDWAVLEDVDIISMSFAILDNTDHLRDACTRAASAGIVMLCSAHDEGSNIDKAWPASYNDTITISACDEYGNPLRVTNQHYHYALRGKEVAAGVVPFLKSDDRISGSSVATAVAAGLSSLILSCDRLANPSKRYNDRDDRRKVIDGQFKSMLPENKSHILLERFAGIDQKIKDGRVINAQEILENKF